MKLSIRTLRLLVVLGIVSLTGLVVLQCILLVNAYESRRQAFERNVFAAMNTIARRLEGSEALTNVVRVAVTAPHAGGKHDLLRIEQDRLPRADSIALVVRTPDRSMEAPLLIEGNELQYAVRRPQHVTLRVTDVVAARETTLVDSFRSMGVYRADLGAFRTASGEFIVRYIADSSMMVMHTLDGNAQGLVSSAQVEAKRSEIIGRALDNLTNLEWEPIARRLRPVHLDSVIGSTLRESGIYQPYVYAVLGGARDTLAFASPGADAAELRSSLFRMPLFPGDLFTMHNALALHFPEKRGYLLRQLGPLLGLSGLFTTAIVASFAFTLVTLRRQREFGIRLTDFINNMTHEFKTPISTIAVAAETITRPDVLGHAEKVLRYTEVIQEENTRMKTQVDTILQMAVLEERSAPIARVDVDLHELVRRAVANIALQVEARGGSVSTALGAMNPVVRGDAVHLSNVIHSLLDNANKYSPGAPQISVETADDGAMIAVRIADRGIGIAPNDQARVFERYFRVHTGNVHDVKGFGLGLSYVKLMAEAHGGDVALVSAPGEGTTVTLRVPRRTEGAA